MLLSGDDLCDSAGEGGSGMEAAVLLVSSESRGRAFSVVGEEAGDLKAAARALRSMSCRELLELRAGRGDGAEEVATLSVGARTEPMLDLRGRAGGGPAPMSPGFEDMTPLRLVARPPSPFMPCTGAPLTVMVLGSRVAAVAAAATLSRRPMRAACWAMAEASSSSSSGWARSAAAVLGWLVRSCGAMDSNSCTASSQLGSVVSVLVVPAAAAVVADCSVTAGLLASTRLASGTLPRGSVLMAAVGGAREGGGVGFGVLDASVVPR